MGKPGNILTGWWTLTMPVRYRCTKYAFRYDTLRRHRLCSIMAKNAQPEKTSDESKMSNVLFKKIGGAILFEKVMS